MGRNLLETKGSISFVSERLDSKPEKKKRGRLGNFNRVDQPNNLVDKGNLYSRQSNSENVEISVKQLPPIVLFDILSLLCNKARSDSDVCSSVYRDVNLMILSQWKVDLHADLFHVGDHSVINSCCSR